MMNEPKDAGKGYVSEIFSSIQGEGLHVGEKQIFVRVAGCSLDCSYCDTVFSKIRTESCKVFLPDPEEIANPVAVDLVSEAVSELNEAFGPVQTVSLTGGEPLEQVDFIANLAIALREKNLRTYLDTNGVRAEAIRAVALLFDVIAVDFKMPSAVKGEYWDDHRAFLSYVAGRAVFVKIVVNEETLPEEIKKGAKVIAGIDRSIPLILQPETRCLTGRSESRELLKEKLLNFQNTAMQILETVRVIPQCHRLIAMR